METLRQVDTDLFRFLNSAFSNPVLDQVFLFLTDPPMRLLLLGLLWAALVAWGGRRGLWGGIALLLAVAAADQIAAGLLKPWVDRVRPCFAVPEIRLLIPDQAHSPSFPSNHAANSFAAAVVASWIRPGLGRFAYPLAALIAFSRVYVGVHYPLDIAAGAFLGLLVGWMARLGLGAAWDRWGGPGPVREAGSGDRGAASRSQP